VVVKKAKAPPAPVIETVAPKTLDEAIAAVMARVPYVKKTGRVKVGAGYTYAGDVDLIRALRPAMLECGVLMVPRRVTLLFHEQYPSQGGQVWNRVCIKVRYRVSHVASGEKDFIEVGGEGADMGDKAMNKAMTGAHKYALRQLFNIETGDADPDETPSSEQARSTQAQGGFTKPVPAANGTPEKKEEQQQKERPPLSVEASYELAKQAISQAVTDQQLDSYTEAFRRRQYSSQQILELERQVDERRKSLTKEKAKN